MSYESTEQILMKFHILNGWGNDGKNDTKFRIHKPFELER